MATFITETKTTQRVYLRRYLTGDREKYVRQPYNLVRYDDNNQYVEPENYSTGVYQWGDIKPEAETSTALIVDVHPFAGVTEIR